MNDEGTGVRPETLALDALIKASIEQTTENTNQPTTDTMLFLGNHHASFPRLVVQDPILEPVDKLVWMAIRLQASETGGNTAFPSYISISKTANVSSKATIARAIAILRATRWLTLCARIRTFSGRFQGNVYALHDEPLPLVDALHLDSSYMQFLRESAEHHHARVQAIASGVLETIDEDIAAGRDVLIAEHPITRRTQAMEVVEKDMPHRFFAFSARVMNGLRSHSSKNINENDRNNNNHRVQILNSVNQVQNLNPVQCSSSYIYTTTTTDNRAKKKIEQDEKPNPPLIYPKRLSDNQHALADRYLSTVPTGQHQAILDELEGRIRSEQRGMTPLYDELSFLHALCKALKNGEFQPNLGIRVHEERIARDKEAQRRREKQVDQSAETKRQAVHSQIKAGRGSIADMRKELGMRPPSNTTME